MVCRATLPGLAVETAVPVLGCYLYVWMERERREIEGETKREREGAGGVSMAAQLFIHMYMLQISALDECPARTYSIVCTAYCVTDFILCFTHQ